MQSSKVTNIANGSSVHKKITVHHYLKIGAAQQLMHETIFVTMQWIPWESRPAIWWPDWHVLLVPVLRNYDVKLDWFVNYFVTNQLQWAVVRVNVRFPQQKYSGVTLLMAVKICWYFGRYCRRNPNWGKHEYLLYYSVFHEAKNLTP